MRAGTTITTTLAAAVTAGTLLAASAGAQESSDPAVEARGEIMPVSGFTGQMSMVMENPAPEDMAVTEVVRFEPWQMLDELFRPDLVFVMRGGPSNWAAEDDAGTAPMDCDAQRLLTEGGEDQMRQLGALLVVNGLRPGAIRVSEWCRAQQTYAAIERGMVDTDMNALDGVAVDVDARLNLLGAAQGNADVSGLREAVMGWDGTGDGSPGGGEGEPDGPLLLITHHPNIEELTNFNVYEGEMLIVDPKRDGRVLGYLRLGSAEPDPIRFDPSVVRAEVDLVGAGQ